MGGMSQLSPGGTTCSQQGQKLGMVALLAPKIGINLPGKGLLVSGAGMGKWVRHSPSLCPSLAPPGAAGRAPAIPSSPEAVSHSQPAPPAVCAVPWGSELSEPPPFRSADSTFEQPAPPVSSPNPELSRSSPGSRPGMLCQAQLTDQSLFSLLLLSLFFSQASTGRAH